MSEVSRRECLRVGLLGGAVVTTAGCAKIANHFASDRRPVTLPASNVEEPSRIVQRLTFGPRPGDVSAMSTMGKDAYVTAMLKPGDDEDMRLRFLLNRLDVFQMDPYETQDLPENEVIRQLQQAAILRAAYGKHQLRERMVDFWTNHFNIYGRKGLAAFRKAADETNVIRKHALGSFPQMLHASSRSSAMLIFLDNQSNIAGHPNENYAREIMELHTLGVHGGYTQKDVQEVARCFTGWTIERRFLRHRWSVIFDETKHDDGSKTVLGHRIPAGLGEKDAEAVLNILTNHPSTARNLATKICANFLGSDSSKWTDRVAETYLRTHGDIAEMLRPMLLSKDLIESPPILKRPFDYVVSAIRALDAETDGGLEVQKHLSDMGEPLYQWPMPDGYPTKTTAWTGTMLPRWNFAVAMTNNTMRGTGVDWNQIGKDANAVTLFERTHGRRPSMQDQVLVNQVTDELRLGKDRYADAGFLCLAAPSFQWR